MAKFIEVTMSGCGSQKILVNSDSISVVAGGKHAKIILHGGANTVVEESIDMIKEMLMDSVSPEMDEREIGAREFNKANQQFETYCNGKHCSTCEFRGPGSCRLEFYTKYFNEKH